MKARTRRMGWIALGLLILAVAVTLVLKAFRSNMEAFITPSEVEAHSVPDGRSFRLGGIVEVGSLKRGAGLQVEFRVTDTVKTVPVTYTGLLPDLFREGKGVVALGKVGPDGVFHANQVLAKHDENYMPPEAADALRRAGKPISGQIFAGQGATVTQAAEPHTTTH